MLAFSCSRLHVWDNALILVSWAFIAYLWCCGRGVLDGLVDICNIGLVYYGVGNFFSFAQ